MAWLTTFTYLCWAVAAALMLPGTILYYIPARTATGELFLRTSRAVAIIAMVTALVMTFRFLTLAD